MSASTPQAVFLSYAREDTEAARRIADALGAFGIEVWFDQSELVGGDAWDAKIRQQIKDCSLFIGVISANTQARREGYFRREWNLAVERTLDMAHSTPFLLPVVIDETSEAAALVPDQFRRVQWTRLPKGLPATQFIELVRRLREPSENSAPAGAPSTTAPRPRLTRPNIMRRFALLGILVFMAAAVFWWKQTPGTAASAPSGPPVVVLMDSPFADRVYDPITLKSGGSNADDISNLLRGLPATVIKEATNSQWNREAEVIRESPSLIVIHRSAFITFAAGKDDAGTAFMDNKLVAFLGYVASQNPRTRFIVYSRHSWEDAVLAAKWRSDAGARFPSLVGRIETWRVPLDRATFRHPITGQELRDSVERQLGLKK